MASRLMVAAGVLLVAGIAAVTAQTPQPPAIWTGVFTAAQAARGKLVFESRCALCHTDDLSGGEGPALIGGNFQRNWGGRYVDRLFKKIVDQMPPEESFTVSEKDKLDIVAFILMMNGFPAGASELPLDRKVLARLHMVGPDGPTPPPTGAMVAIAGCLTKDGGMFKVVNAQEPSLSSLDDHAPDEASTMAAAAPGKQTYRLVDAFPSPEQHLNKKVLAKGLLIRAPNDDQVNVLALEAIAPACN